MMERMSGTASDRRNAARYEVHAWVDVEHGDASAGGPHQSVHNISLGGVCIHAEVVEDVGSIVDLKITFPDLDGAHLEVHGVVVWVNRHPPAEMGIRFLELDEERREMLREFLRRAAER